MENTTILNREEEILLKSLKIEHIHYTLGYLISKEEQTKCATCGVHITIKHILIDCKKTEVARIKHIQEFLHQSLGPNNSTIILTLNFNKEI